MNKAIRDQFTEWVDGKTIPSDPEKLYDWIIDSPLGDVLICKMEELDNRAIDLLDREKALVIRERKARDMLLKMEETVIKGFKEVKDYRIGQGQGSD